MTETIRLIGIDPGLQRTGWGIISCTGTSISYIADGTETSDSSMDLAQRLLQLHERLAAVLAEWQPDEAAVEQTFVNKGASSTLKLGQARGIALLAPAQAGLPVADLSEAKSIPQELSFIIHFIIMMIKVITLMYGVGKP